MEFASEGTRVPVLTGQRAWVFWLSLFLVAMTVGLYWQTRGFSFINYDDNALVYDNPMVTKGLTRETLRFAVTTMPEGTWQPISWLSHMLDCELFGLDAGRHHMTNILVHTVTVLLVFFSLFRLTHALWRSALVAALFAVHPQHVEAVAWVAERKDLLGAAGWFGTMWAYGAWVERRGWPRYALVMACFAFGLLAKPMVVTLPVVLLLLDYWPLGRGVPDGRRGGWWRRLGWLTLEKVPLLSLSLAAGVVTVVAEMKIGTVASLAKFSVMTRLTNTVISYGSYLLKTIWPARLLPFYLYPDHIPWDQLAIALVCLLVISGICLAQVKRHPYLIVGWGWYLIVLLPVIGLVQMGPVPRADRYVYVPQVGIFIMLVWGGRALVNAWRWKPAWAWGLSLAILFGLFGVSYKQIGIWRDTKTLFGYTLMVDPQNSEAAIQLGEEYRNDGDLPTSLKYLTLAVSLAPYNHEAVGSLGQTLELMGRLDEALRCYATAVQLDPTFVMVYDHMGIIGVKEGDLDLAKRSFAKSLEYSPDDAKALTNYALALYLDNQLTEAENYFSRALKSDPQSVDAFNGRGLVYLKQGRVEEAIREFQAALAIDPNYGHAQENLQKALAERQGGNSGTVSGGK